MKTGIELIAQERKRQIEKEHFGPNHDDRHDDGQLAQAAACYCISDLVRRWYKPQFTFAALYKYWPFADNWWKPTPKNRVKELTKAGALIAAEIDRLQRLKKKI